MAPTPPLPMDLVVQHIVPRGYDGTGPQAMSLLLTCRAFALKARGDRHLPPEVLDRQLNGLGSGSGSGHDPLLASSGGADGDETGINFWLNWLLHRRDLLFARGFGTWTARARRLYTLCPLHLLRGLRGTAHPLLTDGGRLEDSASRSTSTPTAASPELKLELESTDLAHVMWSKLEFPAGGRRGQFGAGDGDSEDLLMQFDRPVLSFDRASDGFDETELRGSAGTVEVLAGAVFEEGEYLEGTVSVDERGEFVGPCVVYTHNARFVGSFRDGHWFGRNCHMRWHCGLEYLGPVGLDGTWRRCGAGTWQFVPDDSSLIDEAWSFEGTASDGVATGKLRTQAKLPDGCDVSEVTVKSVNSEWSGFGSPLLSIHDASGKLDLLVTASSGRLDAVA